VNVLLDSRSVDRIWSEPPGSSFVNDDGSLSLTAMRLQVRFGRRAVPRDVRHGYMDAFGFRSRTVARSELRRTRGIAIDVGRVRTDTKVQEWFIPWSAVGAAGLPGEPATGRRLAFAVCYNDQDPGEVGPAERDRLCWPADETPWDIPCSRGRNDTWGQLEMGPVLR
jgi:hypothetical protein